MMENTKRPYPIRYLLLGSVVTIVVIAGAIGVYLWLQKPADFLPRNVVSAVKYTIYYPKPVPDGFSYKSGSARLDGNLVVYELHNGGQIITVTQQAVPLAPPDLSHLPGFLTYPTSIGNGAFGLAGKSPSAIILAPSTLLTLIGTGGATAGDIRDVANNLTSSR